MEVYSELKQAQLEVNSAGLSVEANKVGLIGYKDTTAPIEVNDGTQVHKVLTDKMYDEIKTGIYPSGVTWLDLETGFTVPGGSVSWNWGYSSSSGTFTTTSTSLVDVTNLSASVACSGSRPVELKLINGLISNMNATVKTITSYVTVLRNGVDISGEFQLLHHDHAGPAAAGIAISIPAGSFCYVDVSPPAGVNIYKIQVRSSASTTTTAILNVRLYVREF